MFNDSFIVGNWSGSTPSIQPSSKDQIESVRRWESAETNRLNGAHWQTVQTTADINDDLVEDLQTLQRRCRYEAQNNTLIEGAIETHTTLSLIHISEPTRRHHVSRMPSSA